MLIKHRGKVVDTETGEVYSRRVGRKRGYMAVYLATGVTQDQVYKIRALFDSGLTSTQIARLETYISRRQIASIGRRKAWTHLPELTS